MTLQVFKVISVWPKLGVCPSKHVSGASSAIIHQQFLVMTLRLGCLDLGPAALF